MVAKNPATVSIPWPAAPTSTIDASLKYCSSKIIVDNKGLSIIVWDHIIYIKHIHLSSARDLLTHKLDVLYHW
jgi:hypothetical protein